ncbi:MAG: acyl carrier protein [Gammaproteobacteria bacterium]|nr:acyl carrier protein [Gammaproteobacteria bacterium]
METERKIRDFVLRNYLFTTDENALRNDQSLMQTGVLDSTGILELISFLYEAFEVQVDDEEMVPENLDSVAQLTTFVTGKLAAVERSAV